MRLRTALLLQASAERVDIDSASLQKHDRRVDPLTTGSRAFASPESSTLHHAVRSHLEVGRLQVAMDDALFVRGGRGVGNLPRDRQRLVQRHCSRREPIRERRSLDQFHDQGADVMSGVSRIRTVASSSP